MAGRALPPAPVRPVTPMCYYVLIHLRHSINQVFNLIFCHYVLHCFPQQLYCLRHRLHPRVAAQPLIEFLPDPLVRALDDTL